MITSNRVNTGNKLMPLKLLKPSVMLKGQQFQTNLKGFFLSFFFKSKMISF